MNSKILLKSEKIQNGFLTMLIEYANRIPYFGKNNNELAAKSISSTDNKFSTYDNTYTVDPSVTSSSSTMSRSLKAEITSSLLKFMALGDIINVVGVRNFVKKTREKNNGKIKGISHSYDNFVSKV